MSSSPPVALDLLVAVVAHRALLADRLSSYLSLLIENGFSILYQTHLLLTPEHLPLLLGQGVEDDVAVFTPTSPACVLLLQRVDAYPAFNSLRDQLDFVYGSSNRWTALRDQDTFFPSQPTLERCLLVLKPGYTQEDYAAVMEELDAQAFVTIDLTGKILSAEEAAALLDDPASVAGWSGGISVFVAVEQLHAQTRLSLLLGPDPPSLARTLAPHHPARPHLLPRVPVALPCPGRHRPAPCLAPPLPPPTHRRPTRRPRAVHTARAHRSAHRARLHHPPPHHHLPPPSPPSPASSPNPPLPLSTPPSPSGPRVKRWLCC